MNFTTEITRKIYDNESNGSEYYEVCPDADGLGCVEIRYKNDQNAIVSRMTFDPEQAILIAEAIIACSKEQK